MNIQMILTVKQMNIQMILTVKQMIIQMILILKDRSNINSESIDFHYLRFRILQMMYMYDDLYFTYAYISIALIIMK